MGNCLVTKLKESVNNPYLPNIDDLVLELIGQPGGYPQRSGHYVAKEGTKLQVRCLTPGVEFANGKGTSFEIDGDIAPTSENAIDRSIGLTGDGIVAIGPKSNIKEHDGLGAMIVAHIKELPLSLNGIVVELLTLMDVGDNERTVGFEFFKNLPYISCERNSPGVNVPQLFGLSFSNTNNKYHLEVTELLEMYYHNHNYGTFGIGLGKDCTVWPKFMGTPMIENIGPTPFIISESGIKGYQPGHNGDDNYITCQYDGTTWTIVNI